jgi:hypothetical protein
MEQLTKNELKILAELLKKATTTVESAMFALILLGKLTRMVEETPEDTPKETHEADNKSDGKQKMV